MNALLLLLAILVSQTAHARVLRGDWGSAGDMEMPYNPKYDFEYACQAELTDGVWRKSKDIHPGKSYELFAVWNFELSNDATSWSSGENALWVARASTGRFDEDELVLKKAPPETFPTALTGAAISFRKVDGKAKDRVFLTASARLPLGQYFVRSDEVTQGKREDDLLSVSVKVHGSREEGQPNSLPERLSRDLYIECEKKK